MKGWNISFTINPTTDPKICKAVKVEWKVYASWLTPYMVACAVYIHHRYPNDPKFSDRHAWASSADPDQTAPRGAVWSGSTLFAIPSASFGLIILW